MHIMYIPLYAEEPKRYEHGVIVVPDGTCVSTILGWRSLRLGTQFLRNKLLYSSNAVLHWFPVYTVIVKA